jgi:hypothetical protein
MTWDWSSPIALGLFVLMCGGAIMLVCIGAGIASSGARWASSPTRNRR